MSRKIIQLPMAGIALPADRVDYFAWTAEVRRQFTIEIGNDDDSLVRLHDKVGMIFRHNVYRIGVADAFLLEMQEWNMSHDVGPFMQSELFTSQSTRTVERLTDILQRLHKARRRMVAANNEADRLRTLISGDEANSQIGELQAEGRRRERQMTRHLSELQDFTRAKSTAMTEVLSIDQMRLTEWWQPQTASFFDSLMDESYADLQDDSGNENKPRPSRTVEVPAQAEVLTAE